VALLAAVGAGATAGSAAATVVPVTNFTLPDGTKVTLPNGTSCAWYSATERTPGMQCTLTQSFSTDQTDGNGPLPLSTQGGLINTLNQWLNVNNISLEITTSSQIGIETIGGQGRNGQSCGACSSGKGADPGYAITVQTLGGMKQVITNSSFGSYVDPANGVPPALWVYVGDQGVAATTGPDTGGGGGASSWVVGVQPGFIPDNSKLDPAGDTVFAIGGGGGGGGGVFGSSGSGAHGGAGGSMTGTGPVTTADTTVAGQNGSGGDGSGGGGSQGSPGAAGAAGGAGGDNGNGGKAGIGGYGGFQTKVARFVGSTLPWIAGSGGGVKGTNSKPVGGGGGGGWGGGGGGGSWARQSVSTASTLPTLYNIDGKGFSLSKVGFSRVVLSFGLEPTTTGVGGPPSGGAPTSIDQCKKLGWATFDSPPFKNQGDCVSYVATGGRR
jgi:hypothetical protein